MKKKAKIVATPPNFKKRSALFFLPLLGVLLTLVIIFPQYLSACEISLIRAEKLAALKPERVILDARPLKGWKAGHIPGSFSFSWQDYTGVDKKNIRYRLFPPEKLAAAMGEMGIDENTEVVVYGDAKTSWGGEAWVCWLLCRMGHRGKIKMLSGGIDAWKEAGQSLTRSPVSKRPPRVYHFNIRDGIDIKTADLVKHRQDYHLVDTRSTLEWIRGRLPGAVHISWKKFYRGWERRPLTPLETRELLESKGIGDDKPVVFYCSGGIRSAWAWMVHQLSGLSGGRNYEGGTEAWAAYRKE